MLGKGRYGRTLTGPGTTTLANAITIDVREDGHPQRKGMVA